MSLYINDIDSLLSGTNVNDYRGTLIGLRRVYVPLSADDAAMLSVSHVGLLDYLPEYCTSWNLQLNSENTKVSSQLQEEYIKPNKVSLWYERTWVEYPRSKAS